MKPLLLRSGLTGTVYVVTRYKVSPDGHITAQTKYDVTDQYDALRAADNSPDTTGGSRDRETEPLGPEVDGDPTTTPGH